MQSCNCNYTDKDMITDVLSSQKHMTDGYNNYANEASASPVRQAFMKILEEEHTIAHDVFSTMNQRGWYPVESAPADKVQAAKQKFSSYPCCCQ